MKPEHYPPRFTLNLSGIGIFGIAIYGVAEFLRGKRVLRGVVGALGVIVILAHPLASAGIKLPLVGIQWMIGVLLIYLSVISGRVFYLHFGYLEDQRELEDTEKRLENTSDPEDFIGLDKARLAEYYSINQAQAKASYRLAVVGIISGMVLVICSLWAFTRDPMGDRLGAWLSAGGGIAVNIVSGLFLRLHSKTQDVALKYHDQLMRLQRLQLAMKLAKELPDDQERQSAMARIIDKLTEAS
jgi:hypothetical protein